ncbi:MerR family DNA-binding transcriptional regulator [Spirillospora sp. NPDC050679]
MRIGEMARCAGVSPRALRYYEQQGLISADRDANGYRVYDDDSVDLVRKIAHLLRAGLSSEDVLGFVECLRTKDPVPDADCVTALQVFSERLGALDERIRALTQMRDRLAVERDRVADHLRR